MNTTANGKINEFNGYIAKISTFMGKHDGVQDILVNAIFEKILPEFMKHCCTCMMQGNGGRENINEALRNSLTKEEKMRLVLCINPEAAMRMTEDYICGNEIDLIPIRPLNCKGFQDILDILDEVI